MTQNHDGSKQVHVVIDLNHVDAVLSHGLRQRVEVDLLLSLGAVEQVVDGDVRSRPTHARAKNTKTNTRVTVPVRQTSSRHVATGACVWKPLRMRTHLRSVTRTHLQWTMVLPGCESSNERTLRRKAMIGAARVGTP